MAQTRRRTTVTELERPEPARGHPAVLALQAIALHPAGQRVACAALLALAFAVVYRASLDHLSRDPRFEVELAQLRLTRLPQWIPPPHSVDPVFPPELGPRVSIFEPRLVEMAALAYARCPWVERVVSVEKQYPNRLRARVVLRQPVAAVACQPGGYVLVDANAIRLPGRYDTLPAVGYRLPIIEGALSSPPPAGLVWRDSGVLDGAWLAQLWSQKGMLDLVDVRRIDVSNVGGRVDRGASEVVLYLASDTPLNWGRVVRDESKDAMGLGDHQKIAILRNDLVNSGMLSRDPQLAYVGYLDIQHGRLRLGPR